MPHLRTLVLGALLLAPGALLAQDRQTDANSFTRIMEALANAELRLRDAASKKILLEVTLLKAIEARHAVTCQQAIEAVADDPHQHDHQQAKQYQTSS